MTFSTDQEPASEGEPESPVSPAGQPAEPEAAPETTGTETETGTEPATPAEALQPLPAPEITEPEPGLPELSGTVVTATGVPTFPQPMKAASPGHVNLATVPPMGSLIVPPEAEGGETVVIDVFGAEVDDATAERAYAAARTAGFSLREL